MSNKFRNWCFTFNNYTEDDVLRIRRIESRFCCFQGEIGESGTRHLQGLICFANPRVLGGVAGLFAREDGRRVVHLEPMRGTFTQAREYCKKEDSADPNQPFEERGEPLVQGQRGDLDLVGDRISEGAGESEIFSEFPGHFIRYARGIARAVQLRMPVRNFVTEVHWFYGATGTGKTRAASELSVDAYWKNPSHQWWDGYCGQENVIIDDYRCDFCKFSELLRLFDRYPLQLQVKGGTVNFLAKKLYVTAPRRPDDMWQNRCEEDINQLMRRIFEIREFV